MFRNRWVDLSTYLNQMENGIQEEVSNTVSEESSWEVFTEGSSEFSESCEDSDDEEYRNKVFRRRTGESKSLS